MSGGVPCWENPDVDPDDFFIRSDGKQYADDDFLTEDEIRRISRTVLRKHGESAAAHAIRVERALNHARSERRRQALIRRRRARQACYQCPVRLKCLRHALDNDETHGTWGGYYEEELRIIRRERDRNDD